MRKIIEYKEELKDTKELTEDKTQSRKGKELINTEYKIIDNKKDKYNYKLSQEDKEAILIDYYINNKKENINSICDRYNISRAYLYKLINNYKDKGLYEKIINNSITENRRKFAKKVDAIMNKALDRINNELNDEEKEININQLTTTLGILYDKNALETGKATSNQEIHINVKID